MYGNCLGLFVRLCVSVITEMLGNDFGQETINYILICCLQLSSHVKNYRTMTLVTTSFKYHHRHCVACSALDVAVPVSTLQA